MMSPGFASYVVSNTMTTSDGKLPKEEQHEQTCSTTARFPNDSDTTS
jgi:hypothetical protein